VAAGEENQIEIRRRNRLVASIMQHDNDIGISVAAALVMKT